MMKKTILVCLFMTSFLSLFGQSPWLPTKGKFSTNFSYIHETYDEFYRGADLRDYPFDEFTQNTLFLSFEYGLSDKWALDLTFGITDSKSELEHPPTSRDGDEALTDTRFGIRYQLMNEFFLDHTFAPTLSFRLGAIIEGNYDIGFPAAPGDGGSGIEMSLLIGKVFGETGFGFQGAFGFRDRDSEIPEELFANANIFYSCLDDSLTLYVGYDWQESLDGIDIGDPGFTYERFHETKEISHNMQYGIHYNINDKLSVGLSYAHTIDGRNTGKKDVISFNFSISF